MQPFEWERPDEVLQPNFGEHGGESVVVIVGGHHDNYATKFGTKSATRYTLILLTGKHAGKVATDGLAFGNVQSQLASKAPGATLVARVRKEDRSVTLDNPGGYDMDLATRWTQAFPGQLDVLRRDAVDTYYVRCKELAEGGSNGQAPPQLQQHWSPPQDGAPVNNGTPGPTQEPAQPVTQPGWVQEARDAMPPLPTTTTNTVNTAPNPFVGTGVPVQAQPEQPPF